MNRHRAYWPLDEAPVTDGEGSFVGVNCRLAPDQLGAGWLADAQNVRINTGSAEPRRGVRVLSWSRRPDADWWTGYGTVYDAAQYLDQTTGVEWNVIVAGSGTAPQTLRAYRFRPGTGSAAIPVPPGETIGEGAQLVPTLGGLILLRGPDLDPLALLNIDQGFGAVPEPTIEGKTKVPRGKQGIYWQNRVIVADARLDAAYVDSFWVSDVGSVADCLTGPAEYWNGFRISPGTADRLTACYPLSESALLVVKARSVHVISNVVGDTEAIAANAALGTLTTEYGCTAPRSLVQVGRDVWFLAHRRGVVSVALTDQGQAQGVDRPVSEPIDPWIQRINWEASAGAVATFWSNRMYLAVPIDGSTVNNAVLVYDTRNGAWCSMDSGTEIRVRTWMKFTLRGEIRLGFVSYTGLIYLYEDGSADDAVSGTGSVSRSAVRFSITSRGYGGNGAGIKRFGKLRVRVKTWNPRFSIVTRTDGVNETDALVSNLTRNRLKPLLWDAAYRAAGNTGDNQAAPNYEDYSVITPVTLGTNGVTLGLEQEAPYTYPVRRVGDYLQTTVSSDLGRVTVQSMEVESIRHGVRYGEGV